MKALVLLKVVFICGNCGDISHCNLPIDGQVEQSFCCKARYRLTSKGVNVEIKRLKDKKGKL